MTKLSLILISILLACLNLTAHGQDKLEWSATQKLKVNDFKATPPDLSTQQSLIVGFGLETNFKKEEIENLKTFNDQVANVFLADKSWIDWRDKSRLRYASTLFDLNEWKARELRKRLNENRKIVLAGGHESIKQQVIKEFEKINDDYNADSDYGNNLIGQANWESRINERLTSLADFCKTCGPQR